MSPDLWKEVLSEFDDHAPNQARRINAQMNKRHKMYRLKEGSG